MDRGIVRGEIGDPNDDPIVFLSVDDWPRVHLVDGHNVIAVA